MESVISTASGQASSPYALLQGQTPPLQFTGSTFLELLATLSHEFHTPLTVIEGYTSTLLAQKERLAPGEQDEFLEMIQQAGKRLRELTKQLLEIAQLEAGNIQLDHDLVDLSIVAREAIKEAEQQIPEPRRRHFTFTLQCRDTPGNPLQELPLVKGDMQRLRQVLSHLLENAIRYSPTGGRIDVIAQPAPPPFVEICVRDIGIGIASEHLKPIFDPFYRVDSRLTRESNGLGLGLTMCKHLVTLHQGYIWAESCPGGGSAFHIWLPSE
ncbi:MAG TPA: HAMP domain-containing sensor histidine kinase, partial [Ktedonobacteraceae bacterium]|nr:HAMP domain-containing sensor histidine kinase [Ktedonobacteraceae bacterium]